VINDDIIKYKIKLNGVRMMVWLYEERDIGIRYEEDGISLNLKKRRLLVWKRASEREKEEGERIDGVMVDIIVIQQLFLNIL